MKKLCTLFLFTTILAGTTIAQTAPADDFMRSTGKIYVVVAVIAVVFLGIVLYLVRMDHKITKLEDQINHHE